MNQFEITALLRCLVGWNQDWSYQQVLDNIHESQEIIVWGPVSHLLKEELVVAIETHRKHLELYFDQKPQEEVDKLLQAEQQVAHKQQSVFTPPPFAWDKSF